jgi:hypothetical protein
MDESKLASRLLYLPLFLPKKNYLWLTYKGIKPVSLIPLSRENGPLAYTHKKRIYHWLKDAGIFYKIDPITKGNTIHLIISKDPKRIEEVIKLGSNLTLEAEYELGILLGYPKEAVHAYVYEYSTISFDDKANLLDTKHPEFKYSGYRFRRGFEQEDLKTAILWMETIRKDIPKLAKWFENIKYKFPS